MRSIAESRGVRVEVRSAGLSHDPGGSVAEDAVTVMRELGIDISDEYPKPVTPELLSWADYVIPVQRNHGDHLVEDLPGVERKLRPLEIDVKDPFGKPIGEYREVRDALKGHLSRWLDSLGTPGS
jgi:protein-tyrosine phosphatase